MPISAASPKLPPGPADPLLPFHAHAGKGRPALSDATGERNSAQPMRTCDTDTATLIAPVPRHR